MSEDIEWGDEIAVDGKRPEWLRDGEECKAHFGSARWGGPYPIECVSGWDSSVNAIRLPAQHPAYLAISRGFTPWGGGDEAPGDWDGSEAIARNGNVSVFSSWSHPWDGLNGTGQTDYDIIGYKPKSEPLAELQRLGQEFDAAPTFRQGDYVVATFKEDDIELRGRTQRLTKITEYSLYFTFDGHERYRPTEWYRPATPAEIEQYEAEKGLAERYSGEVERFETVAELMDDLNAPDPLTAEMVRGLVRHADDAERVIAALRVRGLLPTTDIDRFSQTMPSLGQHEREIAEMAIKWARENG